MGATEKLMQTLSNLDQVLYFRHELAFAPGSYLIKEKLPNLDLKTTLMTMHHRDRSIHTERH